MTTLEVHLRTPHPKQNDFIVSTAKRKVVRAGRRGGKTTGVANLAVEKFLAGRRVLYATPTQEQVDRFWHEVKRALQQPIDAGVFYKNETLHIIELMNTEQRIRAKTAWNADTLRGDYADVLILDEYQLMNEETWEVVGAPMLLDNDGDAVFIYTPPSLRTIELSRAKDPRHAAKLYKKAKADTTGRWAAFHFTSHDNPHISKQALADITQDMTRLSYEQEIMAEDKEDNPFSLWKRDDIERARVTRLPELAVIGVGVDPTASTTGDEAGIVAAGRGVDDEFYVLEDASRQGSPLAWASSVVATFSKFQANKVVAEKNNGGEMVSTTINTVDKNVPVELVHASRGKATRAEPVASYYEQGKVHHVGQFALLEDEMCMWQPGAASPNRMDALVWVLTDLISSIGAPAGDNVDVPDDVYTSGGVYGSN